MNFNNYKTYYVKAHNENINKELDCDLNLMSDLINLKEEREVRDWLKDKYNIIEDVSNFPIDSSILLSVISTDQCIDVTVKHSNKVQSYKYSKGEI